MRGWPTHFRTDAGSELDPVSGHMTATDGPVDHRVSVDGTGSWLRRQVGSATAELGPADWLAVPQQRLLETTAGAVFHDGPGTLTAAAPGSPGTRTRCGAISLACQWQRISQEEAFVGRRAEVGDDLGSAVVAARLVRDLMRLCLLVDRRYAPYAKWLGTAFARLPVAGRLTPVLRGALAATTYPTGRAGCARRTRRWPRCRTPPASPNRSTRPAVPTTPAPSGSCTRTASYGPWRRPSPNRLLRDRPLTGSVDQWVDSIDQLDLKST
ncbi:DUF4037 domain-containing protein [Streptomyces sp. KL116D]|uniref:DUF4037 domain-containing protein n=1 Tax=Streptomyces sp. KL116D TaxID=3045152 RepID=UPI003555CDC6